MRQLPRRSEQNAKEWRKKVKKETKYIKEMSGDTKKVERTEGSSEGWEEKDVSPFPQERKMEGRRARSVKGRGRE